MKQQIIKRGKRLKTEIVAGFKSLKNFQKAMKMLYVSMIVITVLLAIVPTGFADWESDIKNIASSLYGSIAAISTAIAVVGEAIAACMYFFSSDGKKVEQASSWMKRIALGWLFINCMNIAVNFITSLVGTQYRWTGGTTSP